MFELTSFELKTPPQSNFFIGLNQLGRVKITSYSLFTFKPSWFVPIEPRGRPCPLPIA